MNNGRILVLILILYNTYAIGVSSGDVGADLSVNYTENSEAEPSNETPCLSSFTKCLPPNGPQELKQNVITGIWKVTQDYINSLCWFDERLLYCQRTASAIQGCEKVINYFPEDDMDLILDSVCRGQRRADIHSLLECFNTPRFQISTYGNYQKMKGSVESLITYSAASSDRLCSIWKAYMSTLTNDVNNYCRSEDVETLRRVMASLLPAQNTIFQSNIGSKEYYCTLP